MTHVLFDDWLYWDINGRPEVCGREEAKREYKGRIKKVRAIFMDCGVKQVAEPLLADAFTDEYLVQHERVGANAYQVIGALKTEIDRVYNYFKPVCVESLVPYPAAVRAFLNGRDLLPKDKAVIFLDDFKTHAVLTIIEGLRFTAPRRISMRDTHYLASEIRRHQKSYGDLGFTLVSNNREWLTDLCSQGIFRTEDVAHVDHLCPALEGLKNAKFTLHFALPEDVLKQARRKTMVRNLKIFGCAGGMVALGLGFWLYAMTDFQAVHVRFEERQQEYQRVAQELAEVDTKKFGAFLKQDERVDYARLYHDFARQMPREYLIKDFHFFSGSGGAPWKFTAVIYPDQDQVIAKGFQRSGLFKNVMIEAVVVQGRMGQRIVLLGGRHE